MKKKQQPQIPVMTAVNGSIGAIFVRSFWMIETTKQEVEQAMMKAGIPSKYMPDKADTKSFADALRTFVERGLLIKTSEDKESITYQTNTTEYSENDFGTEANVKMDKLVRFNKKTQTIESTCQQTSDGVRQLFYQEQNTLRTREISMMIDKYMEKEICAICLTKGGGTFFVPPQVIYKCKIVESFIDYLSNGTNHITIVNIPDTESNKVKYNKSFTQQLEEELQQFESRVNNIIQDDELKSDAKIMNALDDALTMQMKYEQFSLLFNEKNEKFKSVLTMTNEDGTTNESSVAHKLKVKLSELNSKKKVEQFTTSEVNEMIANLIGADPLETSEVSEVSGSDIGLSEEQYQELLKD